MAKWMHADVRMKPENILDRWLQPGSWFGMTQLEKAHIAEPCEYHNLNLCFCGVNLLPIHKKNSLSSLQA